MSINWVMLAPESTPPFTSLPGEQTLYTSPQRISLSITTPAHYPGKQQQPFTCSSSSGVLYLTSRRLIYLPSQQTQQLRSFATPYLNLHDSHVTAPFFGPNVWQALLQPVSGGGIPKPSTGVVELKFTFKDGGAFDFHSKFEQLKERAQQAAETRRSDGRAATGPNDTTHLDLEDLPAYQEESDGPLISPVLSGHTSPILGGNAQEESRNTHQVQHNEPPPGYEEAQLDSVRNGV